MTTDAEIQAAWRRIETWLAAHARRFLADLLPPATPQQIRQAEEGLGVTFPPELRASLAVHEGEPQSGYEMLGGWALFPLSDVVVVWEEFAAAKEIFPERDEPDYVRTEGPVRPRSWDRRWIPIARDGGGNKLMLDLNPPPGGTLGQIIKFRRNANSHSVIAPDFGAWLSHIADRFEKGEFASLAEDEDDDDDAS